jgi:hypothetical protein
MGIVFFEGGVIMNSNIETLATVRIEPTADVYKIVDLLNRTLKSQDLMFGLALEKKVNDPKKEEMVFTIYRTE